MKFGLNNYSVRNKDKFLPNVYVRIFLENIVTKLIFEILVFFMKRIIKSSKNYDRGLRITKNGRKNFKSYYNMNRRNKTWMAKNKDQYNDFGVKTHFRGLETYYNKLTGTFV